MYICSPKNFECFDTLVSTDNSCLVNYAACDDTLVYLVRIIFKYKEFCVLFILLMLLVIADKMNRLYRSITIYYIVTGVFLLFMLEVFLLSRVKYCPNDDQNSGRNV
jgi:hypothetical protein